MQDIQQAGAIILNPQGKVLLVTNSNGSRTFPKGHCEAGETALTTALREIREETGLTEVSLQGQLGTITRPGFTADNFTTPSVTKHISLFLGISPEQAPQPQVADIQAAVWVPFEDVLHSLSYPEDRAFFAEHQAQLRATLRP